MSPPIALGKPDEFVCRWQITPVDLALARFKLRRGCLFVNVADRTGHGIRDTQILFFVVARGRDKCQMAAVIAPINIVPAARARNVVTLRRAMRIGWY